jgi:hypothetical protein
VRPGGQRLIFAFLLTFSIAAQVWNVNIYRNDWRTQLDYYWQLYWRAPAVQPGTVFFSFEQPSPSVTHYSDAGFAHNVLYHYQTEDGQLPYWYFSRRFHFNYVPNDDIKYELRTLRFVSNTSNGLGIFHPTSGCVRILDTVYADDPLFDAGQGVLIPVSNLSQIIPDSKAPPPDPDIFGQEPEHRWCYYFQKADLARQLKDWDTVIELYKQSRQNKARVEYGAEYIPFIEAYAQTGDWQTAYDLTLAAKDMSRGLNKMMCANWARLRELPSADQKIVEQVKETFACSY